MTNKISAKIQNHRPGNQARNRGVGLIEVLVAVLVLSIGLLGLAALQATALRNNQSSAERSMAVIHSYSIIDAMRANVVVARNGGYNYAISDACEAPAGGSQAANDVANWLQSLQTSLGQSACGNINCTSGVCVVRIRWDDSRGTSGQVAHIIETQVRL